MDDDLLSHLLAGVDQQLGSSRTPYVEQTLQRLLKLGISEAEAKIQIALCLGEEMDQILRTRRPFDELAYRGELAKLPLPKEEEPDELGVDSEPPGIAP